MFIMKKYPVILMLAAAAFTAASCSKALSPGETSGGTSQLVVNLSGGSLTKATTPTTGESAISSLHVLVFDSDNNLDIYHKCTAAEITAKSASVTVKTGTKHVWAVANIADSKLSSVTTVSGLKAVTTDLSDNGTSAFIMVGSADATVATTGATAAITLKRLVARVSLNKVTCSLPSAYGSMKVNRVYLANVVGNMNLGGDAAASTWYNKEGVKDESPLVSSHIIDGSTYTASCASLTYATLGDDISVGGSKSWTGKFMYCYRNTSTTAPVAFNTTFSAQRTVLVVVATISSKVYYYPVVLDNATIAANTEYGVSLTITGLGSDHPNKPVEKGALTATVSVASWDTGSAYTETI